MPAKKKSVTRKKTATKTQTKTARKAGKKKAGKSATSKVAAKAPAAVEARPSLEERLTGPLGDLEKLVNRFRRLPLAGFDFASLGGFPSLLEGRLEARFPHIDVVNREKEIVVRAEVPGFDKEDIDVSLSNRTLTIKGESRHEEETEEGDVHRHEIRTGSFSRVVTLPEEVDGMKARASYKDGMLKLTLPKSRKAKKQSIALE